MNYSVLIVEDVDSIRMSIAKELSKKYKVFEADSYDSAISVLGTEIIHLVITDIRMPGKTGLDLIQHIQTAFPNIQYALMTAYNVNEYVNYAYQYGIWNVIPKYTILDLNFLTAMVDKLLTKDIFGVEKYFGSDFKIEHCSKTKFEEPTNANIYFKQVTSDKDRVKLCEKIGGYMTATGAPSIVYQILEELSSNAMIRAPRDEKGNAKYQNEFPATDHLVPMKNIKLDKQDAFDIGYGRYNNTYIIVTRDRFGSLRKEEILKRYDRHIHLDSKTGLPFGLSDSHGRGLFICREISDSLIFNIQKNVMTEVISFIQPKENKFYKSISIYEV